MFGLKKGKIVNKPTEKGVLVKCPNCAKGKIGGKNCIACRGTGRRTIN